jgi:hypothetical protein
MGAAGIFENYRGSAMAQAFMVIYRPGSGWLAGKPQAEQPLQEHGKYILQLHLAGSCALLVPSRTAAVAQQ